MKYYIMAKSPLLDDLKILKDKNIDVQFAFGENDFIDTDFELTGTKISKRLKDMGYQWRICLGSDHSIMMFEVNYIVMELLSNS